MDVGRDGAAGHVLTLIVGIGEEVAVACEVAVTVAVYEDVSVHPRGAIVAVIEAHLDAITGTCGEGFGCEVGVGGGVGNGEPTGAGRGGKGDAAQRTVGGNSGRILVEVQGIVGLRRGSEREQQGEGEEVGFDHAMKEMIGGREVRAAGTDRTEMGRQCYASGKGEGPGGGKTKRHTRYRVAPVCLLSCCAN